MKFTREAWENAPEGATLECKLSNNWETVELIGYTRRGRVIIESHADEVVLDATAFPLRIILPKRKVTVQLWRHSASGILGTKWVGGVWQPDADWTLLGEHTFEIEGE